MPPLNYDILKEICVQASIDQEEIPWNFVLASSQNLKIFHDLIKNVRKIEFKIYGIKAIFDWGVYYLRFEKMFPTNICLKLLSYTPEIDIVTELEDRHLELFDKWTNYERLTVATVGNIETDQDLLEPIMSHVFKMPVEHFTAYASCLIPFVSTIEDKVYESVEIIFENGYFDRLEHMLATYRFHSKNTTLCFTGEYTWYEILYVFTKVVNGEDYKGSVSNIVENLTLHFNGDIEVPAVDELQLDKFFEDLPRCFPNLKKVDCCIDFTSNSESILTEEDASIDLYARTYNAATLQMEKAEINYDLSLEWIREDHVIDISEENEHFAALSEALITTLGFKQVVTPHNEYNYEVEKQVAERKHFKMKVSLVHPSFQDYDVQQDILYDAGLYDDEEDFGFGYEPSDYYDEDEDIDYEGEDYEGHFEEY